MEGLRTSILLFTALLVGSNVHSTNGLCTRMFFAQPVVYDKAMGIGFYFTGINVPSVSACAEYCGKKSFCRTAIFNSYRKTCAISYEYTLNCRYNKNRYTDFDLRHSSSHLIQIACVTKCGGDHAPSMSVRMPVIGTLSKRTSHQLPDSLKKKDVISGKPHDGSSRELVPFEESSGVTAASTWRGYRADYNKVDIAALPITDELNRGYIRGRSQVCFRTIERRYLLGGSFERHTTSSIDECRCLCADTFSAFRLHRCQSLQWYHSGECVLNKDSHLGRYDLIEDKSSIYQYITCDVQVLIDIASKVCRNVGAFKFPRETPAPARTMSTTDRPPLTTYRSQNAESGSAETTKPTNPAEVTETSTTRAEAREKIEPSGVEVVGSSLRSRGHENATESSVLKIVNDGCFEEISGYMMTNVAGGLEHDVSVEECKCLCANSKTHRRYSFECLSATYYHEERDCILNLDDRHQNPHRLKKSSGYAVTYLAMTCGKEEISSSSVNVSLDAYCQGATIPPHPPTTTTPKKQKMEVNSDKCFLELPNFVLEGTALAIETEISHQECKCRCLVGESRYGEACQSFQYYFDSNTCLINKQNRLEGALPEYRQSSARTVGTEAQNKAI
uniref:PAN-1 domain containing protein n=1 Tax=Haemonchus contortus TaxID=6289 RepID=W6NNJ2_HAECO